MTDTKIKTLKTPDWKWIQKSKKNQTEKELDIEKSFLFWSQLSEDYNVLIDAEKKLGKEIWLKKEERKHRLTFLPKLKWVMQASKYIVCVRCDCFALLVKTPLWSILEKFVQLYNIYFHKI